MSRGFLDEDRDEPRDFGALDAKEFEVTVRIVDRTSTGLRIDTGDRRTIFIPFSQIRGSEQASKGVMTLRIPEWLAKQEGML